jgi:predicted kinase
VDKKCIIFDIDGTLANVEHRRHYVADGNKQWGKFFDAMSEDPPIDDVCELASLISDYRYMIKAHYFEYPYDIFVCSGRPETHKQITEEWLKENVSMLWDESPELLMRPENDYRSDVIIKREMLAHIRSQGYDVMFVVDDRQSVVDMWRSEGITCLQCAPGDFDKPQTPSVEPGKLIMLVGPSGSGKSTFANTYFRPDAIISSDMIRADLTGDFRDQSKNKEVFQALHSVVEARIKYGLDAIVDATNIRNKDRKVILDLVPDNCEIEYQVIDRPIEQKIRDGGWRLDVMIGDKNLIEKHDEVFKSNIKAILNGDDDPRVTVIDRRKY